MRIAIFVEGQSELIFLREAFLKYFEYSDIEIECRNLFTKSYFTKAEYDFHFPNASKHIQIINVGNDNAVLSRLLNRENEMWKAGYDCIIGLRDMYSKDYMRISDKIDPYTISKFIEGSKNTIEVRSLRPESIFLCFAVMEIESWIIGLSKIFQKIDDKLTVEFIEKHLSVNLNKIDPETEFYRPSNFINQVYSLIGKSYNKKKSDIEAIMNVINKDDIIGLRQSHRCKSFSIFMDKIFD